MGLEVVEMMMELSKAFNLELEVDELTTVGALFDHIRSQLPPETYMLAREEPLKEWWDRYIDVIERTTSIPRERLVPEANFRDLGLS